MTKISDIIKMNPLEPFLRHFGIVLLDGGMATELERKSADLNDPLWSAKILIESPELIRQVHLEYLFAGADIISSASYQATFEGFERRGMSRAAAKELMQLSVQLACEARDEFWSQAEYRPGRLRPLVAASIGPYGAFLADGSEYRGDYGLTEEALMDFHRSRMEVLVNTGADILAFETVPCLEEGKAVVKLLQEFPGIFAWLSFSCRDEKSLNHGEPIEAAIDLANETSQIIAVGVNCTPPNFITGLLARAVRITQKPLVAYPNSGETWDANRKCWLPASGASDWPSLAIDWHKAGAKLIGGCCRTTPMDIHRLRKLVLG